MEQAIGSVIGGLLSSGSSGGTTNQERTPWGEAVPWLKNNIALGQNLQNQYMANPFSQQQQNTFGNQFAMSDAYRAMLPKLISGLSGGGFDRTNPLARPQAFNATAFAPNFTSMGGYQRAPMNVSNPVAAPATTPQNYNLYDYRTDIG